MNVFYAHGKCFDNEDDFFKFCAEWPDMPFDLEEFKKQMEVRIREAEINNQLREGKMTNRQAYYLLRLSTDWALDKCEIREIEK